MLSALRIRLPRSRIFRDVLTTYSGFLANALLGFVAVSVMAKQMGPGPFGLAMLANLFMAIVAGLAEPGIGTSLVRLASRPGITCEAKEELVVAAIRLKLAIVAGFIGATYMLIPWITSAFLHRPELTPLLRFCLIGAVPLSLSGFAGALFQLHGRFRPQATAIAAASAARTAVVLGLGWSGWLDLQMAVASLVLMNWVQCGLCLVSLRSLLQALPWRCGTWARAGELAGYARYLLIWLVAGTLQSRADTLLLSHYVSDNQVLGLYAAGAQLCLLVPNLMGAINMVLLPRISALKTGREMRRMLRNCGLGALAVLALLVPAMFLAGPLLNLIYGARFAPAAPLFRLLLLAAAAELALNPLSNFWHALNRPGMLSVLNVARLSLLVVVAALSIPRLGAVGAALAVFVAQMVPLTAQAFILWTIIAGKERSSDGGLSDNVTHEQRLRLKVEG